MEEDGGVKLGMHWVPERMNIDLMRLIPKHHFVRRIDWIVAMRWRDRIRGDWMIALGVG